MTEEVDCGLAFRSCHSREVLITFVENEKIFYVSSVNSLANLSKSIGKEKAESLPPLSEIKGALALRLYGEELCRVKILGLNPLKVHYIDYGNEEVVEENSFLQSLPSKYARIPPLAIRIELLCSSVTTSNIYENERRIVTPVAFKNLRSWSCLMGHRPAESVYIKNNIEAFESTDVTFRIKISCVISNTEFHGFIEFENEKELFAKFDLPPSIIQIKLKECAAGILRCGITVIVIWDKDTDTFTLSHKPTDLKNCVSINDDIFAYCQYLKTSKSFNNDGEYEKYGPHQDVLQYIRNITNYPLDCFTNKRTFGPPSDWIDNEPEIGCHVICRNIPQEWFEDEVILLFGRIGVIYQVTLWTDCLTGKNIGTAYITYIDPEAAVKAIEQLNLKELKHGINLCVSLLQELSEFNDPCVANDEHRCQASSKYEICSCIDKMHEEIQELIIKMRRIELNTENFKIEAGKQLSLRQYVYHSLCLEDLDPNDNDDLIKATEFACSLRRDLTVEDLMSIHKMMKPVVGDPCKNGIFRHQSYDDDDDEVLIFGLYGEAHKVPNAMTLPEKLTSLLQELNAENTSFILQASAVSTRYAHLHPHFDGNGRMSRLLFNLILNREGLPFITFPVFEKTRYTEGILSVIRRSDYTIYHRYICQNVIHSLTNYMNFLNHF